MTERLLRELMQDTSIDEIPDTYVPLVELVGLENVIRLCQYSMGDKIYFPKAERLVAQARNRRIKQEYNGHNLKELAQNYDLTTNQIGQIVRDEMPNQISMFDWQNE